MKKKLHNSHYGIILAFLAAICNSTVGVFSSIGLNEGFPILLLAFYRTFTAFIILSFLLIIKRKNYSLYHSKNKWFDYLIAAIFGIFVLFYFEFSGYLNGNIGNVVFGILFSIILSSIIGILFIEKEITFWSILAISTLMVGSYLVAISSTNGLDWAFIYGAIAGAGYAIFMWWSKQRKIESDVTSLWWFFLYGFLMLGAFSYNDIMKTSINLDELISIILLAIVPSIFGFSLSLKAIKKTTVAKAQLAETSEPLWAALFAFIFLNQELNILEIFGGGLILIASIILILKPKRKD